MKEEYEEALLRMAGFFVGAIKGWLRTRLLRKRPFLGLQKIPGIGYRANIVEWHQEAVSSRVRNVNYI